MTKTERFIKNAKKRGYYCDSEGNIYNKSGVKRKLSLAVIRNKYKRYFFTQRSNGEHMVIPVHRFVAYCMYGDVVFNKGIQVRHLNGNSLDNSYKNISYGTASQNMMDKPEEERKRIARIASLNNPKCKNLNHEEVYRYYEKTRSYKKTMQHFGIKSKATISYIKNKFVSFA